MVSKIVNRLNSINSFSKNIIIYGSIISCTLCLSGVSVILYNVLSEFSKVSLHTLGSNLIHSAIVLFAQFVVGSLIIDFFNAVLSDEN
jgi:hypothetical protein